MRLQCYLHPFLVKYGHPSERRKPRGFTREYIWSAILERDLADIDCYQPEVDGYQVCEILKGTCIALRYCIATLLTGDQCLITNKESFTTGYKVDGSSEGL